MILDPRNDLRSRTRLRWLVAGAWLVAVAVIVFCADRRLFRPFFNLVNSYHGLDKVGHFILMGGMAFVFNIALDLRACPFLGRRWLIGGALVALACTLEEFSQLHFPSRTFDLLDLCADYAGILFFGWLAKRLFGQTKQV